MNKNPSMRIVPIALRDYFVKGIPIMETITKHDNIYDFCIRAKTNKSYQAEYHFLNDDGKLEIANMSKTSRYFISKKGGTFYKRELGTGKRIGSNVGYMITRFNKYYKLPMNEYNINYDFYRKECMKIINQIESDQCSFDWDNL